MIDLHPPAEMLPHFPASRRICTGQSGRHRSLFDCKVKRLHHSALPAPSTLHPITVLASHLEVFIPFKRP
jgi:hypothetical protein